ncbi:ParA family protein [Alkalilimnicola ehrlichii MLHE-1]|uniref:ATPase, ParA family n=1 Tax=Alkalilimnicola ehrlichii (strain ATCC BAA-1101 / DSM 17681 / MLHE-1) TaxID=187272 RepID=Q0A5X5_ALKEH|nr:ParA family protein [Alkalilimnicola ehrlichii]ABI57762.1 ATPase, ParA family [Alkalilimnicola ehrlichii MLHE-1]
MEVIAFYNLKGGVGKTAAAVNLAWLAARDGLPTVFWDLDAQGAASWYLGVEEGLQGKPRKLLSGKRPIGRELCDTAWDNLQLLPADERYRHLDLHLDEKGGDDRLHQLLEPLSERYALAVLDCPPSFSRLSENVFRAASRVLVPLVPTPLSLRAWAQLRAFFKQHELPRRKLVPFWSMVDRRRGMHRQLVEQPPLNMKRLLGPAIPYSTQVEQMGLHQRPVCDFAPTSPAARAYEALWDEVRQHLEGLPGHHLA